ncbi:MAG: hypothetical protein AVDCRST_MAG89-2674 [uncultured Gemmatimonadetes bacterium]|uniref:Uncharacterized protein n=1 Tax=uncultured Gemmatimonadota bacterium TaxID=203437 RepID=A0A6J4LV99_9BACT|nr:MAG: hypothetical protein AVDCRST_MAG89-2674 [uncultured Gemmatimonadota bacterium]
MKLRLAHLIQAVFAMLVVVGLSFGATRAFASGQPAATAGSCEDLGYDYDDVTCAYNCPRQQGYCAAGGFCRCGNIP